MAAADIGSVRGKFGCAMRHSGGVYVGASIDQFANAVADRLSDDEPVALGFEAPLYVPIPEIGDHCGRARKGEVFSRNRNGRLRTETRAFSADGGAASLVAALQQTLYIFRVIHRRLHYRELLVGYAPDALLSGQISLLIWEAFVSGSTAKTIARRLAEQAECNEHAGDALLAVKTFSKQFPALQNGVEPSVRVERDEWEPLESFNLVGAALIRSGLTSDRSHLAQQPLVVKAE